MRPSASISLALVLTAFASLALAQTRSYDSCLLVNNEIDYRIYWSINATEGYYYISQSANVDGWLGFGLSADGLMDSSGQGVGSDIAMGYIDAGACANGCVSDYSAKFHDLPVLDATQDIQLLSASKSGGRFTLEWKKKLNTGDTAADRVLNPSAPQFVIWSANQHGVPVSSSNFSPHTHIPLFRGPLITFNTKSRCPDNSTNERAITVELDVNSTEFDLGTFKTSMAQYMGVAEERIAPTEYFEALDDPCPTCTKLDLKVNNYHLTGATTEYVCHGFALPVDTDRHIVAFEVIKDNTQVLHHIVVYEMPTAYALDTNVACSSMPAGGSPVLAWAPGSTRWVMPPDVGIKVGPSGAKFFVFQVHYNNPGGVTTFYDSSGFRIYISDTIRPHDAGMLLMWGVGSSTLSIPAGWESWHVSGGCGPASTNGIANVPGGKITFIGEMHHMHGHGIEAWTDYYRSNGTLVRRYRTPSFDYNAQKLVPINGAWDVLPGDTIRIHCIYNSKGVTSPIVGCEATSCEMCLYLVMYYPILSVSGCNNAPLNSVGQNCSFPCGY